MNASSWAHLHVREALIRMTKNQCVELSSSVQAWCPWRCEVCGAMGSTECWLLQGRCWCRFWVWEFGRDFICSGAGSYWVLFFVRLHRFLSRGLGFAWRVINQALRFGVENVVEARINQVCFESDSLITIGKLKKSPNNLNRFGSLIFDNLEFRNFFTFFFQVLRKIYGCTHNLIKYAYKFSGYMFWICVLSFFYCNLDLTHGSLIRKIPTNIFFFLSSLKKCFLRG